MSGRGSISRECDQVGGGVLDPTTSDVGSIRPSSLVLVCVLFFHPPLCHYRHPRLSYVPYSSTDPAYVLWIDHLTGSCQHTCVGKESGGLVE